MYIKADKEKIRQIQNADQDRILRDLISQINNLSRDGQHVLMVIDNAEELVEHTENDFKLFAAQFLNECEYLSLVVTSRRSMGTLKDTFQGKIQLIHALKPQQSVELFFERTAHDSITAEECFELLVMDAQYPINKLKLQSKFDNFQNISSDAKNELLSLLQSKEY